MCAEMFPLGLAQECTMVLYVSTFTTLYIYQFMCEYIHCTVYMPGYMSLIYACVNYIICKCLSISTILVFSAVCECGSGSTGQICSVFGGQCSCAVNVGGRDCSFCRPSTYGLSSNGCISK